MIGICKVISFAVDDFARYSPTVSLAPVSKARRQRGRLPAGNCQRMSARAISFARRSVIKCIISSGVPFNFNTHRVVNPPCGLFQSTKIH